jgi:uncharacterized protein
VPSLRYVAFAIGALVVLVAGIAFRGEVGQLLLAGVEALPFIVLAVLAQLGNVARTPERRTWARVLTWIWLLLMVVGFGLFAAALAAAALFVDGARPSPVQLGLLLVFVPISVLVALPILFSRVRLRIARRLPIDPDSLLHTVALFFAVYFVCASFAQLAILGGNPPLLTTIQNVSAEDLAAGRSAAGQILDLFYGLAWMLPLAFIAAGYPLRRAFGATVIRLGFVRPTRWQLLFALGAAAALVLLMNGVDSAITWIWTQLGWPTTNAAAFDKLLGAGISPVGAVAIGVTAGIGEEILTRGLLQPRFGLLLPNLAFTAAHAFQYGPDALISVFLVGMILAVIRARTNTSTGAIVHGTYDFILVMLSAFGY